MVIECHFGWVCLSYVHPCVVLCHTLVLISMQFQSIQCKAKAHDSCAHITWYDWYAATWLVMFGAVSQYAFLKWAWVCVFSSNIIINHQSSSTVLDIANESNTDLRVAPRSFFPLRLNKEGGKHSILYSLLFSFQRYNWFLRSFPNWDSEMKHSCENFYFLSLWKVHKRMEKHLFDDIHIQICSICIMKSIVCKCFCACYIHWKGGKNTSLYECSNV